MKNLSEVYRRALLAHTAENPASRRAAFRLRYDVYCLEREYEDVCRYPERMETDAYDDHARHALVRSRGRGGSAVGASRLVLDTGYLGTLPIESHGSVSVSRQLAQVREHADTQVAEVSRLAVTRRLGELVSAEAPSVRVRSHDVTMGLLALFFQQSWVAGITHWVALMETGLLRALARVGIHCHPIGTVIEHRGARQPVMARLEDLWAGVRARGQPLAALACELGVPWNADWSRVDPATAHGSDIG